MGDNSNNQEVLLKWDDFLPWHLTIKLQKWMLTFDLLIKTCWWYWSIDWFKQNDRRLFLTCVPNKKSLIGALCF